MGKLWSASGFRWIYIGVPYFRLKPGCACWIFFHWNCPNILNQHMGNSDIYRWLSLKENFVNSTWLESGRSPMISIDLFHSYHPCILYIYIHIIYICYVCTVCMYICYVCMYIYICYVCMYVCIYMLCMYIYIYMLCMYVYIYMLCMYIYIYVMYVCIYIYMLCMYIYICYVCVYIYMLCMYVMYIYIYVVYVCIYIYMLCMYVYIYIQVNMNTCQCKYGCTVQIYLSICICLNCLRNSSQNIYMCNTLTPSSLGSLCHSAMNEGPLAHISALPSS